MSRILTCPLGHQWHDSAKAQVGENAACPVCLTPGGPSTAAGGADDAVPPPPRPAPDAVADIAAGMRPTIPVSDVPPAIPGYEILGRLGQGGMGVVYQARHRTLDRLVALKVLPPRLLAHPDALRRFRREARAAARLDHPHIAAVYDAGDTGSTPFLVMEYVEGTDLARHLERHGPLPVAQACDYARQAVSGLQHAHERGLVHRDVKPSNLLVTPDGIVKLLDLGLARLLPLAGATSPVSPLTQDRALMGTPDYLAPEQALDASGVDSRADVYSLGCTLYHLLAGSPPFPGGSLAEKLLRHQQKEPEPVESLRPDLPPGLGAVLRKMMAKRPADRYQRCAEVAEALAPFCRTAPGDMMPPAPPRRSPFPIVAGVVTAVALALLLFGFLKVLGPAPPSSSEAPTLPPAGEQADAAGWENVVGMRFVRVPPGTFGMGASEEERDVAEENELPRHEVEITRAFFLGRHEVTQGQYEAVMGMNPSFYKATHGSGPDHPVEQVSWNDAVAFCRALSGQPGEKAAGRSYRLPSEAEWEYSCRAGSTTPFHFGPALTSDLAAFDGGHPYPPPPPAKAAPGPERPTRVGRYPPNRFGLYDMHGNVIEWCNDWYASSYYKTSAKRDPPGPEKTGYHVVRGGGWESRGARCRSAARGHFKPDYRHSSIGFRVVCVLASGD